jgi:hypothetical protein
MSMHVWHIQRHLTRALYMRRNTTLLYSVSYIVIVLPGHYPISVYIFRSSILILNIFQFITHICTTEYKYFVFWLFDWWHRWRNDTNVILADEMGLGKTIQSVSMLGFLHVIISHCIFLSSLWWMKLSFNIDIWFICRRMLKKSMVHFL